MNRRFHTQYSKNKQPVLSLISECVIVPQILTPHCTPALSIHPPYISSPIPKIQFFFFHTPILSLTGLCSLYLIIIPLWPGWPWTLRSACLYFPSAGAVSSNLCPPIIHTLPRYRRVWPAFLLGSLGFPTVIMHPQLFCRWPLLYADSQRYTNFQVALSKFLGLFLPNNK